MYSFRATNALELKEADLLLRTITAPCMPVPLADLIAQTCATTLVASVFVLPQRQVLELDVTGFVLP
ncbi:hypothetical protein ACTMSW_12545 [Micromonospora sp. BQ11]|uniref:hypothetical protein n=1 Tax=Micromonospora sp. BQ11 TaxID=3452212 RepID=UPI003F886F98